MSKYVWCEDSASGFEFWKNIFKVINPEFTVQTKRNNTELRKAASRIEADGNEYYILIDSSVDNHDVVREVKKLKEYNVPLVKTQMKKIIVTAKTLYSHPKNVSKIYAALHTDLAW